MDFESKVDKTIEKICDDVNSKIGLGDTSNLHNMIDALAHLVSARAKCKEVDEIYVDWGK